MPKIYSTTTSLVIVESPAKCKKIEEYLGPGYKCLASFGHLRELSTIKNIDIQNNFHPTYNIIDNALKKKQIELLKKEISVSGEVILATDDDREGEAIAWHICQLFNLNIDKTKRIIFHEITESALQNAIRNPSRIKIDIVQAQQARQILDLLVGFKVSPILWKYISTNKNNSLSAGRCQTPSLKIIYDNYLRIKNTEEKKVYNVTGYFTNNNIPFVLTPENKYETEEEIIDYLTGASEFNHMYTCSQPKQIFKKQPEPFTTSKIQQIASSELHFSPKETMRMCQNLYEAGYITYMRTDSKTYSKEFIDSIKEYILRTYGDNEKYMNENIDLLIANREKHDTNTNTEENPKKTKNTKNQKVDNLKQEAHEAIRPTKIGVKALPDDFDNREKRLYKLIWENTMESCMSPASFLSITANINSYNESNFRYTSELIHFPGWMIVSNKYSTDNKEYQYLQTLKHNYVIPYKKIVSKVTIKNTVSHYTEAKLVQILEEKGIGRPSTFSMLVDKIQERGYVKKEDVKGTLIECKDYELENDDIFEIETKREFGNEKGKLVIQQLGIIVMEFLDTHFNELFQYDYTKNMEDDLDKISKGEQIWHELCKNCNDKTDELISNINLESKLNIKIDDTNSYIIGKNGPVIKCNELVDGKECVTFKSVKKDIDIHKLENGEYCLNDIVETNANIKQSQNVLGKYDNEDVILRKSKFGLYVTWGTNSKTLKELGNRPLESITFQDVEQYLSEGSNIIRQISDNITIRKSKKGDYIFFKTLKMKKPAFYSLAGFKEDYRSCDINELKSWIKETHNVF
jgi:DNA topoisomerase-1